MKIMQAGHPINTTFHSESSEGAVRRFLTAYLSESGNEPSHLALATLTDLVDIVVVQKIMRDGKRRIIQISEVLGTQKDNPNAPLIYDLYRYEIDRDPIYDEAGRIVEIVGQHKRVGCLSEPIREKFRLEGVPTSRYDFLLREVSGSEVETDTGKNIDKYGLDY